MKRTSFVILIILLFLITLKVKCENLFIGSNCQAHDGSKGVCVFYKNCKSIEQKLRNQTNLLNQIKICNTERRYVCCPLEDSMSSRFGIIDEDSSTSSWKIEENDSICGKQKILSPNVYYGNQIHRGTYPWIAALTLSIVGKFFCSGSLVSKNLVVTAAHCIEGNNKLKPLEPKDIFVILGAHNLTDTQEPGRITMSVKSIHVHHEWNRYSTSYDADIAMIKLIKDVIFDEYIQPLCIAASKSEVSNKTEGIVVGFGKSEFNEVENVARFIKIPIHSYEFCANSKKHQSLVTHRTFCAGYKNGTNVCTGDSGGGLMVVQNGKHYLRGIVSSSIYNVLYGCEIYAYAIFTDVLDFHSWITTGQDDKLLLRDVLEKNKKLELEILEYKTALEESRQKIFNLTENLIDRDLLINQLNEEIKLLKSRVSNNSTELQKDTKCKTNDESDGVCIDFNDCETVEDVHVFPSDEVTFCNKELNYICCTDEKKLDK